jgi:hypothetical protein
MPKTRVVLKPSETVFHKGHKSPELVMLLTPCNGSYLGTLQMNRKNVPEKVKKKELQNENN